MRITQLRQADLNLLVVFTVLAEERNVSRAARRLLLSQPAVSRALQRLREMFHDDLLVRTAGGYELTPQGQRLMEELEVTLPRLDRLLSGKTFDPAVETAHFRIAATDYAAAVLAPVVCRDVLPRAAKVRIDFVARTSEVFEELKHGSVDLAISAHVVEVPSALQSQGIFEEEFVCAVAAESDFEEQIRIAAYLAAEHVSIGIQGMLQVMPDKPLAAMGYVRKIAISVPYHEAAIRCVRGTSLIATIPRRLVDGGVLSGGVRVVKAPEEIRGFRAMMTWHPRLNSDAAHAWLRATMREVGDGLGRV